MRRFGSRLGHLSHLGVIFAAVLAAGEGSAVSFLPVPPPSVMEGDLETDVFFFIEQALATPSIVLGTDVLVSSLAPGMYTFDDLGDLPGGSVSPGQEFTSWLVHWDTPGTGTTADISGSVTFPKAIVALMLTTSTLDGSDADFASPTTMYSTGNSSQRGLEFISDLDSIMITKPVMGPGPFTLDFTFQTRDHVDQIRVLTRPIPEPSAPLVFATSALALGLCSRRRVLRCP